MHTHIWQTRAQSTAEIGMYVCMYVCMYACMYVCMIYYRNRYVCMYACMYVCMIYYRNRYVWPVCMYVCMYVWSTTEIGKSWGKIRRVNHPRKAYLCGLYLLQTKSIRIVCLRIACLENFERFSTADLFQFTGGTPSERFPFILQVAVPWFEYLNTNLISVFEYFASCSTVSWCLHDSCTCACWHVHVLTRVMLPFLGAYTTRARVYAEMCTCLQESSTCVHKHHLEHHAHVCISCKQYGYMYVLYIYIHIYIYIHTYIHSLFVSMCMCVYLERIDHMQITRHIYIYTYAYTFIHTYTCTW